jgi:hypothetical protein
VPNVDSAFGLVPHRHITGGEIRSNAYPIASGYAANIFRGDPVILAADGSLTIAAALSTAIVGVFAGVKYTDALGNITYSGFWPANTVATNIEAMVYDDPDIAFKVQTDATGAVEVDKGALCSLEIVAGDPKTGQSKTNLDVSAGLAATGKQMRILRLIDNGGYNEPGPFSQVEAIFATHAIKGVVAGVGGV